MCRTDAATPLTPDANDVSKQGKPASTLELFFNPVFVFAFTQVTGYLVEHQSLAGPAARFSNPRGSVVELGRILVADRGRIHRRKRGGGDGVDGHRCPFRP